LNCALDLSLLVCTVIRICATAFSNVKRVVLRIASIMLLFDAWEIRAGFARPDIGSGTTSVITYG
jgi:hypothetical protein